MHFFKGQKESLCNDRLYFATELDREGLERRCLGTCVGEQQQTRVVEEKRCVFVVEGCGILKGSRCAFLDKETRNERLQ